MSGTKRSTIIQRDSDQRRPGLVTGRRRVKPWLFGVLAGIIFVGMEAFFSFYPPAAYGFCLSCHTRDLINTIVNSVAGTSWGTSVLSSRSLMLTSPAVLAGAFFGAFLFRDRKIKKAETPVVSFIYGFCVMTFGILIFGCPTRLLLRAGYGDVYAVFGVIAMYVGVLAATAAMRARINGKGLCSGKNRKNRKC